MDITIRNERPADYRIVEELTREAFWNLHVPGCDEHYFAHVLRKSPQFIPELDFVALLDNKIVGNIMYTHSYVEDSAGTTYPTITFGPISVLPEYQNMGIGSALIQHSTKAALLLGHTAILIFGFPTYYSRFGFKNTKEFNISDKDGKYPMALQALELAEGVLYSVSGKFIDAEDFNVDPKKAEQFDLTFPPKEKKHTASQEIFMRSATTFL